MKFIPIKTRVFLPPRDSLWELLDSNVKSLKNNDVIFITSKILAIHQGRCIKISPTVNKDALIRQEADASVYTDHVPKHRFIITIKDHTLIPSAGIDESNANGYYVLWPKNTNALLKQIHSYLKRKHGIKNLGVIATDSHTIPMRYGVVGISTGFYGIEPLYDYRGKRDIFGRKLKYTKANIVDALSAMATLLMGEGNEKTPIVIARGLSFIKFVERSKYKKLVINPKTDIYYPLLKVLKRKHE